MNIQPVLLFCFLSVLQDGNIGLINAQIPIYTRTEGESITAPCSFTETGIWKYFCTAECKQYILEMSGDSHQRDRYSMRYYETGGGSRLDVTITQLRKSDSGRYWCGLTSYNLGPHQEFKIIVTDAPTTSTPKLTVRPSPPTPTKGMILYLAVSVTVLVLLAVFLPLLYKWKKRSSNDVNSRSHSTDMNMEAVVYDDCVPVSTLGESDYENDNPSSTYETLNPATMSPDQTYSTLRQQI